MQGFVVCCLDQLFWVLRCLVALPIPGQLRCNGLSGSEYSDDFVAQVVAPIASEPCDPEFLSLEEPLLLLLLLSLLRLLLLRLKLCCESLLQFSDPLRELMDLRCQGGHCSILFCHVAGLGALCCCCSGKCGCSKSALRYHASDKRLHSFLAHLSQRVCVGMTVLRHIKCYQKNGVRTMWNGHAISTPPQQSDPLCDTAVPKTEASFYEICRQHIWTSDKPEKSRCWT